MVTAPTCIEDVMKRIKDNMDDDNYERYEPFLIIVVGMVKHK